MVGGPRTGRTLLPRDAELAKIKQRPRAQT